MKKVTLLIFISLLGVTTSLLAQSPDTQKEEDARKIIESAEYILEATVVPGTYTAYFGPDSTESYGSFLINISKVFRGNIRPGTAEVIHSGASISFYKNGMLLQRSVPDAVTPGMHESEKYIVFANNAPYPSNPSAGKQVVVNTDKKLMLRTSNSHIAYPSGNHELFVGPALMQKFKTEREVYQYLSSFQNIRLTDADIQNASGSNSFLRQGASSEQIKSQPLPETAEEKIQNKISHYKSLLKQYEIRKQYRNEDNPEKVAEAKKQLAYWEKQLSKLKKKEISEKTTDLLLQSSDSPPVTTFSTLSDYDFTFSIANQAFTEGRQYYEFDVFGSVNQADVYLDWVQLYLDYNTSLFGGEIGTNHKITVTNGSLYNTNNYAAVAFDEDANTIVVAFLASTTDTRPYKIAKVMQHNIPELLYHVKIQLNSTACGVDTNLDYNTQLISANVSSNTFGQDAVISTTYEFDNIYVSDFVTPRTCEVLIESLSYASPLIPGKDHELIIHGSNFGSTRGTGKVQFKNADDGGATYLSQLDDYDYISWSENLIKVRIPSRVRSAAPLGGSEPTPGSGKIKVVNALGNTGESSEEVTFDYALHNYTSSSFDEKYPYYLRNQDASGGITFHLGSGMTANADARAAIEKALKEWSCNLNIDLKLGADVGAGGATDGQNVIYLHGGLGTRAMVAGIVSTGCGSRLGGTELSTGTYTDLDIAVSSTVSWHYPDFGSVPNGKFDFYATILHEIGHLLGLCHVVNSADLMYFSESGNGIPSASRKTVRSSYNARSGAQDIVATSKQLSWMCALATGKTLTNAVVPRNCEDVIVGINDYIDVEGPSLFSPGDFLTYNGRFVSHEGNTYPTQWNWTLNLIHGGGAYTYGSQTTHVSSTTNNWYLLTNAVLPDYAWVRTANNWVLGELTVTTIDNNGELNITKKVVEVRFKPNMPAISQVSNTTTSLTFFYNSPGATSYKIHYSTTAGGPYTGTGALEGNSPVNAGTATTFTLNNLDIAHNTYYFKVEAINGAGSVFSAEERTSPVIVANWPSATAYCNGQSFSIPFLSAGFTNSTTFTAWLSDASGSFANKQSLGSFSGSVSGSILATIPAGIPMGTGYRIYIAANSPIVTSANNGVNLTIKPFLSITAGNALQPMCAGYTSYISLSTSCPYTGQYTFTVQLSDVNGAFGNPLTVGQRAVTGGSPSQTISFLLPQNLPFSAAYRIRIVCEALGIISAPNAPFTIRALPVVTMQPANTTICEGQSATFTVQGTHADGVTYSWQGRVNGVIQGLSGSPYNGIQTNTLTLNPASFTYNNWEFRCIISSAECYSVTEWAALTVSKAISTSTIASTLCAGGNITIPFTINGCTAFNPGNVFTAQLSDPAGSFTNATTIGAITATGAGSISAALPAEANGANYRIRVISSNPATVGNDNGANLNIVRSILTGSIGNSICTGINFSVPYSFTSCTAFAAGNIFTAEISNATGDFANPVTIGSLTGTSSGSITANIPGSLPGGSGYRIRVVSSNPYRVGSDNGININLNQSPQIMISTPRMGGTCTGETLVFSSSIINGGSNPTYQWKLNSVDIPGATSPSFSSSTLNGNDIVTCTMVSNSLCASSAPAISNAITVIKGNQAPIIITQPTHVPACGNQAVTYSVVAGGNNLKYQWQYISNGAWADIPTYYPQYYNGTKTPDLVLTVHPANIGNQYRCKVSGACTGFSQSVNVISNAVTHTILGSIIGAQPTDKTVCAGQRVSFTVTPVRSSGTATYKWRRWDGNTFSDLTEASIYGLTDRSSLTIVTTPASLNGYQYACEVGNTLGNCPKVYTNIVTLTVNSCAAATESSMEAARPTAESSSDRGLFSLYPNPASSSVVITAPGGDNSTKFIRLLNPVGTKVFESTWGPDMGNSYTIDLGSYSTGLYLLYINNRVYKVLKN